jgi:hypothetical protein
LQHHCEWADACLTSSMLPAPQQHQYITDRRSGQ